MENKVLFLVFLPFVYCAIQPKQLPSYLRSCLKSKLADDPSVSEAEITTSCMKEFLWVNRQKCAVASDETVDWLSSLVQNSVARNARERSSSTHVKSSIRSRSINTLASEASVTGLPRQRKEYRMLTDQERRDFHDAVNALKRDTSILPNKYDAMVKYHEAATQNAHGGPAFLAWHRYFLVMYELALQEINPNIMIPYWDSTLDEPMSDPADSVLWTHEFLGNGHGNVNTGPFANWSYAGLPMSRSINSFGNLIRRGRINRLINTKRGPGHFVNVLEQQHNGVHGWVGGNMNSLTSAPSDPVFYMHHAYIDCAWEFFRQKRSDSTRYPYVRLYQRPYHKPYRRMGLPPLNGTIIRNRHGYANFWTEEYYTCAPAPSCNNQNPDCGSKWLRCDLFLKRCVSKGSIAIQPEITPESILQIAQRVAPESTEEASSDVNTRTISREFSPNDIPLLPTEGISDSGTRDTTIVSSSTEDVTQWEKHISSDEFFRMLNIVSKDESRSSKTSKSVLTFSGSRLPPPALSPVLNTDLTRESEASTAVETKTVDDFVIPEKQKACGGLPTQNSFSLNCKTGTDLWAFVPIQVIHLRHGDTIYDSHPVDSQGQIFKHMDIFSLGNQNFSKIFSNLTEKRCYHDKSGLTKIKIAAYGVDYDGMYEDHVFLDNRQMVSKTVTYMAIRNPGYSGAKVFFNAIDECGMVCQPMILVKQRKYGYPLYRKFTGTAFITNDVPIFHSNTYHGAQTLVWKNDPIPYQNENQIPFAFYCNYSYKIFN